MVMQYIIIHYYLIEILIQCKTQLHYRHLLLLLLTVIVLLLTVELFFYDCSKTQAKMVFIEGQSFVRDSFTSKHERKSFRNVAVVEGHSLSSGPVPYYYYYYYYSCKLLFTCECVAAVVCCEDVC